MLLGFDIYVLPGYTTYLVFVVRMTLLFHTCVKGNCFQFQLFSATIYGLRHLTFH